MMDKNSCVCADVDAHFEGRNAKHLVGACSDHLSPVGAMPPLTTTAGLLPQNSPSCLDDHYAIVISVLWTQLSPHSASLNRILDISDFLGPTLLP